MLVLDFVRETPAGSPSILLPRIHSGHLGFVPGTRVHVATPTGPSPDMHTEVIVTPFHTTPGNTALVSVVLHDAVGVVRSLVQALSWLNINIEVQESSSINHLDLHRVGMIVDLGTELLDEGTTSKRVQQLYGPYAANVPIHSRRYVQLFDMIVALCGDALWWHDYEQGRRIPALYVRPLTRRDELNPSNVILEASGDKRHTEIKLPENIADHIRARLDVNQEVPQQLSYMFVSDTNDRTLRTFFLPDTAVEQLVHVGMYHSDRAGTLARVLDVIAAAEFNIITSLLRKHSEHTSVWEAVLEYRGVDKPPRKPASRERLPSWYRSKLMPWMHEKLSASPRFEQIDGCRVEIGPPRYPSRYGGANPNNLLTLSRKRKRTEDPPKTKNATIISLLEQRKTNIKSIESAKRLPADRKAAADLIETVRTHRRRIRQRTLFLSYPKTWGEAVNDYLRPLLEPPQTPSYHLTELQDSGPDDIQKQIVDLISETDYFLAIWHPDEGEPRSLSPWMLFEYGIARAANKPIVVACHADLEAVDLRRLVGNDGLIMYSDANFARDRVQRITKSCAEKFRDDDEAMFDHDPPEEGPSGEA